MSKEPALIIGAVAAVLQALVALGVVVLTDTQIEAVVLAVNSVVTLVAALFIRSRVSPV